MIFSYKSYDEHKEEMLNASFYDAGKAAMLKLDFKRGYGNTLFRFFKRFNRLAILNDQVRYDWIQIARQSLVFRESAHSVDCIMQEFRKNSEVLLSGYGESSFKKSLRAWRKDALRETSTIKEAYRKLTRYDKEHYDPIHEQRKLRKAIKFIHLGVATYYTCSLPTFLTIDEYDALSAANKESAKDRYRLQKESNCYVRIGKKKFKPAVILFGYEGAKVLFQQKIDRFDSLCVSMFGHNR